MCAVLAPAHARRDTDRRVPHAGQRRTGIPQHFFHRASIFKIPSADGRRAVHRVKTAGNAARPVGSARGLGANDGDRVRIHGPYPKRAACKCSIPRHGARHVPCGWCGDSLVLCDDGIAFPAAVSSTCPEPQFLAADGLSRDLRISSHARRRRRQRDSGTPAVMSTDLASRRLRSLRSPHGRRHGVDSGPAAADVIAWGIYSARIPRLPACRSSGRQRVLFSQRRVERARLSQPHDAR
jgi:hypothetical protein